MAGKSPSFTISIIIDIIYTRSIKNKKNERIESQFFCQKNKEKQKLKQKQKPHAKPKRGRRT
jgi:hypothetical protein